MNLYIDCEWNGYHRDLISMALVSPEGHEFYEVLPYGHMDLRPWVAKNVIPVLGKNPLLFSGALQGRLRDFLAQFYRIHIIADWPEDIARFCDALIIGPGLRIETPHLTFEVIRVDTESKVPHNALEDARALMRKVENK